MSANMDDHNRGGLIAFTFSMVATIVFFVVLLFGFSEVDLKEVKIPENLGSAPGAVAEVSKAVDVAGIKEPWISTEDLVAHGKKVYATNCAMCHGATGKGDGAAAATLVPKPRDLVGGQWKRGGTTLELFETITKGFSTMPAWGQLSTVDRLAVVHFVRSITSNKVADDEAKLKQAGPGLK